MEYSEYPRPTEQRCPLLEIRDLTVAFPTSGHIRPVVDGISFEIAAGQTLGLVGESGCGKTSTALALMGLVPASGQVSGSVRLAGSEVIGQSQSQWRSTRGRLIAMIFQEPMTSLNPVMPVGKQVAEVMVLHEHVSWRAAAKRAVELLAAARIASPQDCAGSYPHQLSGGMRQRVMIAMALACRPVVLIADEPTTALDVTTQAQILELIADLQAEFGMALLFISHNIAVVSEVADEIMVMYAGRIVERAPTGMLLSAPRHPYTRALLATLPYPGKRVSRLPVIVAGPSGNTADKAGCRFAACCPLSHAACRSSEPLLKAITPGHFVACIEAKP